MGKFGTTREQGSIGDKLLPKIMAAVRETMISTKKAMLPWEHHIRVKATQDIIDKIGHEIADHYGPFIDKILEQDTSGLDPAVLKWLQDSRSGEDQLKAVSGLLMGSAQSAIGTFLSNELAPFVYKIVGLNPQLYLDPGTAAAAVAQYQVLYGDGERASVSQGYGPGEFAALVDMARSYPAAADAINFYTRKLISRDELILCLQRNSVPQQFIDPYIATANNPLSLADAALAYLRSDISLADAQSIAHDNGYTDAQLDIFIGNTGEPLGLEQLLEAYRRGFIDQATVERGIKQSRVRNEWIPTALALRYTPMSVADAVNAVVQNYLTQSQAQIISNQNGLEPSHFPVLVETAGEPLSRTEMSDLYNRGEVTEDDVKQALRESRVKDKYIDDAFALHVKLLEPRMLSEAVEFGAITQSEAAARALRYGFSPADAEILVSSGTERKIKTYRQQIVAAAESLYEDSAISESDFLAIAQSQNFEQSEANFLLQTAEYRRQAKLVSQTISVIRSKFIGHHIAESDASGYLDNLGVPATQRDQLLGFWGLEAAANVRNLTEAQIVKAAKDQLITPEDAGTRLINMGYSQTDAGLLLQGA